MSNEMLGLFNDLGLDSREFMKTRGISNLDPVRAAETVRRKLVLTLLHA